MRQKPELDAKRIINGLKSGQFIKHLRIEDTLESTQKSLMAQAAAKTARIGTLLVAEKQTAGMGRLGRTWDSEPYASLTFSFLCPNFFPMNPGRMTIGAALAAAQAIETEADLPIRIKWPNDLYIEDRKLAGVLAQGVQASEIPAMVIGIGINVNAVPEGLSTEGNSFAVCLKQLTGKPMDRSDLLVSIMREIEQLFLYFSRDEHAFLAEELRKRSLIVGARVVFENNLRMIEGELVDHGDDLSLLVKTEQGVVSLPGETSRLVSFEL